MTYNAFLAACTAIEKMYDIPAGNGLKCIHTLTIADGPVIDYQPLLKNKQITFVGTGVSTQFTGFIIKIPKLNNDTFDRLRLQFIPIENIISVSFLNKTQINSICEIVHKQFDIMIAPYVEFTHDGYVFDTFHELYGGLPKNIYTSLPCEVRVRYFKTQEEQQAATKDSVGIKVQLPGTYYVKAFAIGSDDFVSTATCTVKVLH